MLLKNLVTRVAFHFRIFEGGIFAPACMILKCLCGDASHLKLHHLDVLFLNSSFVFSVDRRVLDIKMFPLNWTGRQRFQERTNSFLAPIFFVYFQTHSPNITNKLCWRAVRNPKCIGRKRRSRRRRTSFVSEDQIRAICHIAKKWQNNKENHHNSALPWRSWWPRPARSFILSI